MKLKIAGSCSLGKKMPTSRDKDAETQMEIVTCQLTVRQVPVDRETMDELAGLPIGCTTHLYGENGYPWQHMSFLLPKRTLRVTGHLRHKHDDEGAPDEAVLDVKEAQVENIRFNLSAPKEGQELGRAEFSFTLKWKAAGDEVEAVEDLLGRTCGFVGVFTEPPRTKPMFPQDPPQPEDDSTKVEIHAPGKKPIKTTIGAIERATAAAEKARRNRRGKGKR